MGIRLRPAGLRRDMVDSGQVLEEGGAGDEAAAELLHERCFHLAVDNFGLLLAEPFHEMDHGAFAGDSFHGARGRCHGGRLLRCVLV